MPNHVFTIVARGHAVDVQTNQLTVFGIVEGIGAPSAPFRIPELSIVTLWSGEEAELGVEFMQRVRILDPDGRPIHTIQTGFGLERQGVRLIAVLQRLKLDREGVHHFEVCWRRNDNEHWSSPVARYPVRVSLAVGETAQPLLEDGT